MSDRRRTKNDARKVDAILLVFLVLIAAVLLAFGAVIPLPGRALASVRRFFVRLGEAWD